MNNGNLKFFLKVDFRIYSMIYFLFVVGTLSAHKAFSITQHIHR